ncbi:MAG: HD domain-containing protein [Armatimonadetes bacterium]|nr:HD domain-containing protein [Armatimonadota bacterium]
MSSERQDTIRKLLTALEDHHPGEMRHAERVAVVAVATANELGLDDSTLERVHSSSMLHDVGKLSLNADLLQSTGLLTREDREQLETHVDAIQFLNIDHAWMEGVPRIIRSHHERWDGTGYPNQLKGEDIPIEARLIAVAEVYDTLAYGAIWKEPIGEDAAAAEIEKGSGTWFDPSIVEAFQRVRHLIQPVNV